MSCVSWLKFCVSFLSNKKGLVSYNSRVLQQVFESIIGIRASDGGSNSGNT